MGDHGTSVAGVAAAAADNGLGGRGVAPGVRLVGFNPMEAGRPDAEDPEAAFETAMLLSLGGGDSAPDSASEDADSRRAVEDTTTGTPPPCTTRSRGPR